MLPLYHEPHFTFRFGDDRIIPRFHLTGVEPGTRVAVFKIDPGTGERLGLLAKAVAGEGGWVDLPAPILVRAGNAFLATTGDRVSLRPVRPCDLHRMYAMQLDPEANRMAVTIPRTREAFDAHWAQALADPRIATRAVLEGEAMVGYVSCFPLDGQDHVGYWIDRAHWGMGIASRALDLLVREITKRPLVATAATSNGASLRVLRKCGFVIEEVRHAPASERFPECEEAVLVLR